MIGIFNSFADFCARINDKDMKYTFRLLALVAFLMMLLPAHAQRRNSRYNEYIKQYAPIAVEQMRLHKIPASITLAQGLLESGAGQSVLARKVTITSASSVTITGAEVGSITMMMPVANVSGLIVMCAIHTRTIPSSLPVARVMLFCSS